MREQKRVCKILFADVAAAPTNVVVVVIHSKCIRRFAPVTIVRCEDCTNSYPQSHECIRYIHTHTHTHRDISIMYMCANKRMKDVKKNNRCSEIEWEKRATVRSTIRASNSGIIYIYTYIYAVCIVANAFSILCGSIDIYVLCPNFIRYWMLNLPLSI